MQLIELSANKQSFHKLEFNPYGLSVIVGDSGKKNSTHSNGVGKTLSLRLIDYCLGANAWAGLDDALDGWSFRLIFRLNKQEHSIERTVGGKHLFFDEQSITLTKFRSWLDAAGIFNISERTPHLTFRSLLRRFARVESSDCIEPDKTHKEQPFEALLRTAFLLGVDTSLIYSKQDLKKHLDQLSQTKKIWQDAPVIKNLFRIGHDPRVKANWLNSIIPELEQRLEKFVIAEDYRAIEQEANNLTHRLREVAKIIESLKFQKNGIEKLLNQTPDITQQELLSFYSGLESIFKSETLKHFDAVESFHSSLNTKRKQRLTTDLMKIQAEMEYSEQEWRSIAEKRDKLTSSLQGKSALEEYRLVANDFASKKEELKKLEEFLSFDLNINQRSLEIKENMLKQIRQASEYLNTNPLTYVDGYYRNLTALLYPHAPSGITLENNAGENKIRYDLKVHLEGSSSDGINAAKILCFDWTVFLHGNNHNMQFLWHDNRLFADLDQKVRAKWFSLAMESMAGRGRQYITTINEENYTSMLPFLEKSQQEKLDNSIILKLSGDSQNTGNKLLGVQFDL